MQSKQCCFLTGGTLTVMFMDVRPRRVPGPLPQHGVQTQSGPLNEAGTHSPRGPGCGLSKAAAIDQSFPLTSGKLTS